MVIEASQPSGSALRAGLARVAQAREEIAKAWLVEVIRSSSLESSRDLPTAWAATELPAIVGEVLAAAGEDRGAALPPEAIAAFLQLTSVREETSPDQVGRELSALQLVILSAFRHELLEVDPDLFAETSVRLAALFGPLTGAVVEALAPGAASSDRVTGLGGAEAMRERLDQLVASQRRYGQPFALILFDVDYPQANGNGEVEQDAALATVAGSLRDAIRSVDEAYRLENDELCLLAPALGSAEGSRMAERLSARLAAPGALGGHPATIAAGVVACPDHGEDPERLLRQADTAMWRARATGLPVTVGGLQDPSHSP